MITRRCTQRQFLLRPSKKINNVLLYCLAVAAERYGMQIHAFFFASNHWHGIASDPHGNRPEFCRWFHEFTSKAINAHRGRWENLWSSEQTSVVDLVDEQAQVGKTVYSLSNPVKDALVAFGHHWPGVRSNPRQFGRLIKVRKPRGFFRKDGPLPKVATLRVTKLPAWAHLPDDEYARRLAEAVEAKEAELREQLQAEGRPFLGVKRILAQSPFDNPNSHAPKRQLNPQLACGNTWARVEALQRRGHFLQAYAEALARFVAGDRNTRFPIGTYWMRVYAGVICEGYA